MSAVTPPTASRDAGLSLNAFPKNGDAKSNVPVLALNVEQACEALGVSWKVWREHVEPEIKLLRLGRCKRVPVVELERFIAEHAENVLERR